MDAMLEDFAGVVNGISFRHPALAVVSNLTGECESERLCSPDYWVRQVRDTVRFADGIRCLANRGVGYLLEVGPDGVLSAMADECLRATKGEDARTSPPIVPALKAGLPETLSLFNALAELWTRGAAIDWTAILGVQGVKQVQLPTYPFQRRRYWLGAPVGYTQSGTHAIVNSWRYRVSWKPITTSSEATLAGSWLAAVPSSLSDEPWVGHLIDGLRSRGAEIVPVPLDLVENAGDAPARFLRETLECVSGEAKVSGVISLLALVEEPDRCFGGTSAGLLATLGLAQALERVELDVPLWLLTRGAVSVAPSDRVRPIQAQTWGFGLTLGLEHPHRLGGLADLPETLDERVVSLLASMIGGGSGEDQLAIRGAGVFARRLTPAPIPESAPDSTWTTPSGTVLITGGTGGLGAQVARWLARGGAEHLLLVGRRGSDAPAAPDLRGELLDLGTKVTIAACDVSEREQLASLIDSLPEHLPLRAVVHAAGEGSQGAIASLEPGDLEQALAAKARGALNLDALTSRLELSAFVLFSSIAGTLGSGSQAAYAAANACLDALAAQRRERGLPATSIAWGPWEGAGMAGDAEAGKALRRRGLEPMVAPTAMEALQGALLREETFVAVADIRWERYAPLFALARPRPLIEDLVEVQAALRGEDCSQVEALVGELRGRLQETPSRDRRELLLKLVRTEVARVLGHSSSDTVDPRRAFKELGFDSLTAVELRNRLDALTGLGLPATLAFDYPSPDSLVDYLLAELVPEGSQSASLEAELARLELTLASLEDDTQRSDASARLRALLARLEGQDREHSQNGETGRIAVLERVKAASDEEIFDFIDQELGSGI
jgi:acyl transferase domain-containing protein/acyl carrier protein